MVSEHQECSNTDLDFEPPTLNHCDQLHTIVQTSSVVVSCGFGWWPYSEAKRRLEVHETFEIEGLRSKVERDGKRRTDTNDTYACRLWDTGWVG